MKLSLIFAASAQAPFCQLVQTLPARLPMIRLAGRIPVADNEHLPVQDQVAIAVGGGGKLVGGGAVVGAAVAGGLDQHLPRAKRRAP